MDELINSFSAAEVTTVANSTARDHPHFSLYKVKSSSSSQEQRRKKFLEAQKLKRFDYVAHARGLATNEWDEDGHEVEEVEEEMECEEIVKPSRSYKNQLMLSEWMVEVPSDLETEWLLVLCPIGKRCLVVSSRGVTKAYSRSGWLINTFPSQLPSGNRTDDYLTNASGSYCLLDCIYSEIDKTYYVLDIMCWNSVPCFDADTEFRFFWLHSKLSECPGVETASKCNPFQFIPLPNYCCDRASIRKRMESPMPFKPELDGLLFYHRRAHYFCGTTPLVTWLKGYMLPEILGIDVPESLANKKPSGYVNMEQHLPKAFAKHHERKLADERNMEYSED